jgi:hypothetical protein
VAWWAGGSLRIRLDNNLKASSRDSSSCWERLTRSTSENGNSAWGNWRRYSFKTPEIVYISCRSGSNLKVSSSLW